MKPLKPIETVALLLFFLLFTSFADHPHQTGTNNYENTYAVVVGIADYKYEYTAPDLTFTVNDAEQFIRFLTSPNGGSVPKQHIFYLKNKNAKKANIIHYAKTLYEKAGENDRIIFMFSGHGGPGVLVPHDGAHNPNTNLMHNMLTYEELKQLFKDVKCKSKLIIADACHSGSIKAKELDRVTKGLEKEITKTAADHNIQDVEVAIMVASSGEELSYEVPDLKQGLFSYFLIQGLNGNADLNGDNVVTIHELHTYVFTHVKEKRPGQTPQTFGKFDRNMVVSVLNK